MKANIAKPSRRWTINAAAREFNRDRKTLSKRLRHANIMPGADGKFSTRQICAAVYGGMDGERLREVRHRANLLELQEQQLRRELVPVADVQRVWGAVIVAIRQYIWNCNAEEIDRRRWLAELVELKVEDYFKGDGEIDNVG
jgi:hypothetical protein